jgi:TRAP-type C4-dicarboxylate transport system permease small subunit
LGLRKFLDSLYWICGVLAGVFMVGIALCILIALAGSMFGFVTRSMDEFAGYSMAASAFLAFSYTFHANEHIRVTLFLQRFRGRLRSGVEIWCHLLGTLLAGFFAWYSVKMVVVSWQIKELSQGLIPLPLWIPQLAMAGGTVMLTVALLDRLVGLCFYGMLPDQDRQGVMES